MIALVFAVRAFFKFSRVHCERVFVHIDKHRPSVAISNGLGRSYECVRNGDHFISRPDPQRQESKPKRVCAIANADGVLEPQ